MRTGAESGSGGYADGARRGTRVREGRRVASLVTCPGRCRGSIGAGVGDSRAGAIRACVHHAGGWDPVLSDDGRSAGAHGRRCADVRRDPAGRRCDTAGPRQGAVPDDRDAAWLRGGQDRLRIQLARRRRVEHLPVQQRLLRPRRLCGRQLHGAGIRTLLRRRPDCRPQRALRAGVSPTGGHAL